MGLKSASTAIWLLALLEKCFGQALISQNGTWNSTFLLSDVQIHDAGLNSTIAHNVDIALQFEQSNWAGSSAKDDHFYSPPQTSSHLPPGSLLKVERYTNTSYYTMPPNTALSRIMFQSEKLNGSAVPASAYVLWPWMPRKDPRKPGYYAVVVFGHGTSGCLRECAPSHIRNLWYHYIAPYILALQGYVVVAPDYAGMGVDRYPNGTLIRHQWLSTANGYDMIYSVQAAQKAFPKLSNNFVVMGHSQGGHAAWSVARILADRPLKGYLGTIAASPADNLTTQGALPSQSALISLLVANGLDDLYPGFNVSNILTAKGEKYLSLLRETNSCNSATDQLTTMPDIFQPDFTAAYPYKQYADLMVNGGHAFAGPLLVLQGTGDMVVAPNLTTIAVNKTCEAFPNAPLEYATFEATDHVPTVFASQTIWIDWIADRFAGRNASSPCTRKHYSPAMPVKNYQKELEYFLEDALQMYEVA